MLFVSFLDGVNTESPHRCVILRVIHHNNALALLFLSSNAISPSPAPSPSSEDSNSFVVVDEVGNNTAVQALGRFAVIEAYKRHPEGGPFVFVEVFAAKYLSSDESITYFLNINATKIQDYKKIKGNFLGYVYVTSYSKKLLSYLFQAAGVWVPSSLQVLGKNYNKVYA